MLRNLLAVLALFALAATARAAIGDDLQKLRATYGSASQVGNQMLFKFDGYSIAVYFDNTRSAMEIFVRDGSKPDKMEFTQADIDAILVLEGQGLPWNSVHTRNGAPTWLRADRKLIARFNPSEKILAVIVNEK